MLQLIYGYIEKDDDDNDETNRNLVIHFKDKGSFTRWSRKTDTFYVVIISTNVAVFLKFWRVSTMITLTQSRT